MKNKAIISIWKDPEALSVAAAYLFLAECSRCVAEKGSFVAALSGGSTPKRLYQLLATPEFSSNIPWEKVYLFWSDERFVPYSDPESNYRMAKENLLDHIPIPGKNIFTVPIDGDAKKSAKKYEATLAGFFKDKKIVFDWLLLGVGDDGHTASLFPGTAILKEKKRFVREVWAEKKQAWRISFTLPLINNAAAIIFLISGKEKAAIVARLSGGSAIKPLLPSQLVKPRKGILYWMLDKEAASKI